MLNLEHIQNLSLDETAEFLYGALQGVEFCQSACPQYKECWLDKNPPARETCLENIKTYLKSEHKSQFYAYRVASLNPMRYRWIVREEAPYNVDGVRTFNTFLDAQRFATEENLRLAKAVSQEYGDALKMLQNCVDTWERDLQQIKHT